MKPGGKAWIYDFRSDMTEEGWDLVRERLDTMMRPVFDAVVLPQWEAALTEGQIRGLTAWYPFNQVDIGVMTVEMAGVPVPAVTRLVLQKE